MKIGPRASPDICALLFELNMTDQPRQSLSVCRCMRTLSALPLPNSSLRVADSKGVLGASSMHVSSKIRYLRRMASSAMVIYYLSIDFSCVVTSLCGARPSIVRSVVYGKTVELGGSPRLPRSVGQP